MAPGVGVAHGTVVAGGAAAGGGGAAAGGGGAAGRSWRWMVDGFFPEMNVFSGGIFRGSKLLVFRGGVLWVIFHCSGKPKDCTNVWVILLDFPKISLWIFFRLVSYKEPCLTSMPQTCHMKGITVSEEPYFFGIHVIIS